MTREEIWRRAAERNARHEALMARVLLGGTNVSYVQKRRDMGIDRLNEVVAGQTERLYQERRALAHHLRMCRRERRFWVALFSAVTALALVVALSSCTTAQQAQVAAVQAKGAAYQAQIARACAVAVAMTLAPVAGPVAPWIIGGCSGEEAIARLALDPSSLLWVESLVAKAKGVP